MKNMPLEWTFEITLKDRQDELIAAFKPVVSRWANHMRPVLHKNLHSDPLAGCSTATDLLEFTRGPDKVWLFLALFVNRDIGDDVIALVAASERSAELMAQSFLAAMSQRMGEPTREFSHP